MKVDEIPSIEEQLAALDALKDEDIDLSDIPEVRDWSNSVRGKFYCPPQDNSAISIDSDVLAWFKDNYQHYQTAINAALREYVTNHRVSADVI